MKTLYLVCASLLLVACGAAAPVRVMTSSGKVGFNLECKRSRESCLVDAGDSCGSQGYHVISESSHPGNETTDAMTGPVTWFNIQVECGRATTVLPQPQHDTNKVTQHLTPGVSEKFTASGVNYDCVTEWVGNTSYTRCQ